MLTAPIFPFGLRYIGELAARVPTGQLLYLYLWKSDDGDQTIKNRYVVLAAELARPANFLWSALKQERPRQQQ